MGVEYLDQEQKTNSKIQQRKDLQESQCQNETI